MVSGMRIAKSVGRGRMGEVFLAEHLSMERQVALKILPASLSGRPRFVKRFLHDVRTAARLDHPNIAAGYDAGQDDGVLYLATAFVDGDSLSEVLEREGPLPEQQALQVSAQAARALAHAWNEHRMLHCDVKPANIMLDRDGEVKLLDTGLVGCLTEGLQLTGTEALLGTPPYMSPEQANGHVELDARSDMYSLGITLFQLVTGTLPDGGSPSPETLAAPLHGSAPPPRERNPSVSTACEQLILAMTAKDRGYRHATWEALIRDFERVAEGDPPSHAAQMAAQHAGRPAYAPRLSSRNGRREGPGATAVGAAGTGAPSVRRLGMVAALLAGALTILMVVIHRIDTQTEPWHVDVPPDVRRQVSARDLAPQSNERRQTDEPSRPAAAAPVAEASPEPVDPTPAVGGVAAAEATPAGENGKQAERVSEATPAPPADAPASADEGDAVAAAEEVTPGGKQGARAPDDENRKMLSLALAGVAADLIEGRFGPAWQRWLVMRRIPSLLPLEDELGEIEASLKQAMRIDEAVLKGFERDVGKIVTVQLATGSRRYEIRAVQTDEVRAMRLIRRNGRVGRLGETFGVSDLSTAERIRRIGMSDVLAGDVGVLQGLLAANTQNREAALESFREAGGALGQALTRQLEKQLAERAEEQAGESFARLLNELGLPRRYGDTQQLKLMIRGKAFTWQQCRGAKEAVGTFTREHGGTSLAQTLAPALPDLAAITPTETLRRARLRPARGTDVEEFVSEIRRENPGVLQVEHTFKIVKDAIVLDALGDRKRPGIDLCLARNPELKVLPPMIAELPLAKLDLRETGISDLGPLRGTPLRSLDISSTKVRDLTPLRGMGIETLTIAHNNIGDLWPLQDCPIHELNASDTATLDLSALTGLPLTVLNLDSTRVEDLSPLRGLQLTSLQLYKTEITNIDALRGMPLVNLSIQGTKVRDLTPLEGAPLEYLTASEVRFERWPDFRGMPLKTLRAASARVPDLEALRGLPLRTLDVSYAPIGDLGPLEGMPLQQLTLTGCPNIQDLDPLRGMPLTHLELNGCAKVRDLTPLLDCERLAVLIVPPKADKGQVELLRKMLRHLRDIRGL